MPWHQSIKIQLKMTDIGHYPLTRGRLQQMKREELREKCQEKGYRVTGEPELLRQRLVEGDQGRRRSRRESSYTSPRPTLVALECPPAPEKQMVHFSNQDRPKVYLRGFPVLLLLMLFGLSIYYQYYEKEC